MELTTYNPIKGHPCRAFLSRIAAVIVQPPVDAFMTACVWPSVKKQSSKMWMLFHPAQITPHYSTRLSLIVTCCSLSSDHIG